MCESLLSGQTASVTRHELVTEQIHNISHTLDNQDVTACHTFRKYNPGQLATLFSICSGFK